VRRFWVASRCSLVVASYPPCPFPRCAPHCCYRRSTCNPPHEQLLIGLEAGGALSSVVCHSFVVVCRRLVVIVRSSSVVIIVCCHLFVVICCHLFVVICCHLFIIICCHLFIVCCLLYVICSSSFVVVDWRPSSLPIRPASSGSQRQGVGADM
jgi:hypothetical protein